jgi:predicted N-acyltransferase
MYLYDTEEQVNILQRMAQISEAMQQFEFYNREETKDYKTYLKMLEELEKILLQLRESQTVNNGK